MSTHPAHVRTAHRMLSLSVLLILAGCGERTAAGTESVWRVVPFDAPLDAGSEIPNLSSTGDGAVLSWWAAEGDDTALRFARVGVDGVGPSLEIVRGDDFFVNWADFHSISELPSGRLVAHWLQRGDQGGYDYGVRVATSMDGGASWDAPWTPHVDGTPTEHGFVSLIPEGEDGFSLFWLDGRQYADGPHGAASDEMTLRMRDRDGTDPGEERLLDDMVCDCCQTSAAWTSVGPILVYRDRTADEIRDIYTTLRVDGEWTEPRPIHDDGWEIAACPVNGPQVEAEGDFVVVSWFTAADDRPRVQARVSTDGGRTFGDVLRLDQGNPIGRVDVVTVAPGRALVSWVEGIGDGGAEIRLQEVADDGLGGDWFLLAATGTSRSTGFPRMTALPDGRVVAAWTDTSGAEPVVRLATVEPVAPRP